MKILVLNSGSSSIKYKVFESGSFEVIASGLVERIGEETGHISQKSKTTESDQQLEIPDHKTGLHQISAFIQNPDNGILAAEEKIDIVGHRVVHGGEKFSAPTIITQEVKEVIEKLSSLAPLHNPPNLLGIQVAETEFPEAVQVAIFDTAYHQTLPDFAYRYAIPNQYYQNDQIRRYGMHGTSHQYVVEEAARYLDKDLSAFNAISLHLGNGCSATAVRAGKSIDTSLGLSPLPGLIMGTRSGDIDPAVIFFLMEKYGYSHQEVDNILNKKSGLKGITGSNDLREITEKAKENDENARLALDLFTYQIKKYIGSYLAITGNIDALIFTAGIGENSALVRNEVLKSMDHLGMKIDERKNETKMDGTSDVSAGDSKVKILVVPTNEELAIAHQAIKMVESGS